MLPVDCPQAPTSPFRNDIPGLASLLSVPNEELTMTTQQYMAPLIALNACGNAQQQNGGVRGATLSCNATGG
jgi:hypothetical protein